MPERSADYRVVLFGSGAVGKTSLVLRFVKETFHDSYNPTVEDTYWQVIGCERGVCMLHITDTSGSYQFPAMQRLNISKSDAFVLVYSVTSRRSLEELKPVHQQVVAIRGSVEQVPIMLVGNKSEDDALREVQEEDGAAEARAWKCGFIETSAKNQQNVTEVFQELLRLEKKRNLTLINHAKLKRDGGMKRRCSVM